jgi:hypothetical protein
MLTDSVIQLLISSMRRLPASWHNSHAVISMTNDPIRSSQRDHNWDHATLRSASLLRKRVNNCNWTMPQKWCISDPRKQSSLSNNPQSVTKAWSTFPYGYESGGCRSR